MSYTPKFKESSKNCEQGYRAVITKNRLTDKKPV
jgi:hypothetical protein